MPVKSTNNSIIKKVLFFGFILFLVFGTYLFFKKTNIGYYLSLANNFISASTDKVNSDSGRVNILILGKADEDHAGSDLTDTMIFSSVSLTKPHVVLVSIPRDVWIPEIRAKVNSAYYWGNQKEENGGLGLAKSTVSKIFGAPIQYGVVVDFSGFTNVVDVLGGVEVDVQNPFVDEKYPIKGKENDLCDGDRTYTCRYEVIKFEKGMQLMNGETALKFVRSRNAKGDEGTDIAREARQQLVINAVKDKVLSGETLFNPRKLSDVINVGLSSLETDIDEKAATIILRRLLESSSSVNYSLIPEEFLEHPMVGPRYDNQYVFIPKGGSWEQFQKWFQNLLNS